MSLKDILAFPYLPSDEQVIAATTGTAIDATPFKVLNWGNSDSYGLRCAASIDSSGRWLIVRQNYVAGNSSTGYKMNGVLWPCAVLYATAQTGVYYFGFRWKFLNINASATWLTSLLSLVHASNQSDTYITELLLPADIGFSQSSGTEYYIEGRIDFPNQKVKVWVDGALIKEVAIASGSTMGTVFGLNIGGRGSPVVQLQQYWEMYLRDGYFKAVDSVADDYRLGPQLIEELSLTNVSAPNWTPTGAVDIATALNTQVTTVASKTATYGVTDAARTPLTANPVSKNTGSPINGFGIDIGGQRRSGSGGSIGTSVTQGGNTVAGNDLALNAAMTLGATGILLDKDPAGNKFTDSSVGALTVTITPKS